MLTEQRFEHILDTLNRQHAVTVSELTALLDASESTVRRDLNTLAEMGKLIKVHGGATALTATVLTPEETVAVRAGQNVEEKTAIARYAASVVQPDDFVFLDAGTTTERIIDFLPATTATFVTNGVAHARKLIARGLTAYIVGGQLKLTTEAVVGAEAVNNLRKYNFTKCFLGTNGIDREIGFSTPDVEEALVKSEAARRSFVCYVLADHTKFGRVSSVTFADLDRACIVTDRQPDTKYRDLTAIKVTTP